MDNKNDVDNSADTELASIERTLQSIMQDIGHFVGIHDLALSSECKSEALGLLELSLRQKMRTLRRWRNGTDHVNVDDLRAFQRDLAVTRLESIRLRTAILSDAFNHLNSKSRGTKSSNNLLTRKKSIQGAISDLEDQYATLSAENMSLTGICEANIKSTHRAILNFAKSIEIESTPKSKTHSHQGKSKSSVKNKRTQKFEDHPDVNRVLKCVSRIRTMMEAFRRGYHVTTDTSPGCSDNDMEVLQRQLHRVQLWQESVRSFATTEVDDLEVILDAIQKHVEPTFDLDSPTKVPRSGSSRSSSRPNSRLSETSSEAQYTNPPPATSETPPTYEEACLLETDPGQDCTDSGTDVNLVNERLI